jgi:excisionase family DNA binding protein
MSKLLTPAQVAERLSVATRTAQRWMSEGSLPAILLPSGDYRMDPATLASWEAERLEIASLCRQTTPNGRKRTRKQVEFPIRQA